MTAREDVVDGRDAWSTYAADVVLEVVVGSTAWGLAGPGSDEDVAGAFLLPFEAHVSLFRAPDEIGPPDRDGRFWEVERLIRLALRADPLALETLFAPDVVRATDVGLRLRAARDLFPSRRIQGSFGRYATGQLDALSRRLRASRAERTLADALRLDPTLPEAALVGRLVDGGFGAPDESLDLLRRLAHAAHDRGDTPSRRIDDLRAHLVAHPDVAEHRPKGAYHLLRLLHSGLRWAIAGEPLLRIDDPALRDRLLAIKAGVVPLDDVLVEARELAAALEVALATSALPVEPDLDGADALLRECRALAARRSLAVGGVFRSD